MSRLRQIFWRLLLLLASFLTLSSAFSAPFIYICGNHDPRHAAESGDEMKKLTARFGCENWDLKVTTHWIRLSASEAAHERSRLEHLSSARQQDSPAKIAYSASAEDKAFEIAVELTSLGYAFSPTSLVAEEVTNHYVLKDMIPVTNGMKYVLVIAASNTVGKTRAYFFDDTGEAFRADLSKSGSVGVYSFKAKSTGTVEVFVEADQVRGKGSIAVLVARRGIESGNRMQSPGWEPTFKMGGSPTPAPPAPAATIPPQSSRKTHVDAGKPRKLLCG